MIRKVIGPAIAIGLVGGVLAAPVAAQRSLAAQRAASTLGIHGFSVVLVIGSSQGTAMSDLVPEAARKALTDMKDFLPYRRYQLLDAAWMLCCASFSTGPGVSGRVRGPDNRDYNYSIDPLGVTDGKANLHFTLREITATTTARVNANRMTDSAELLYQQQLHEAVKEAADAEKDAARVKKLYDVGMVTPEDYDKAKRRYEFAQERVAQLNGAGDGARKTNPRGLIDSTFAISPGETVVIGTSRLMGDQALIAVLTAATKPQGTR